MITWLLGGLQKLADRIAENKASKLKAYFEQVYSKELEDIKNRNPLEPTPVYKLRALRHIETAYQQIEESQWRLRRIAHVKDGLCPRCLEKIK